MPNRTEIFGAGIKVTVEAGGLELDVFNLQLKTGDYFYGGGFSTPTMSVAVNLGKVVNKADAKVQLTPAQFKKLVEWGPAKVKCTVKQVPGLTTPVGLSVGEHIIFEGAVVAVSMAQEASFLGGGNVSFGLQIEHRVAGLFQGDLSKWPVYGATPMAGSYLESERKISIERLITGANGPDIAALAKTIFDIRANPSVGNNQSALPTENIFNFSSGGDALAQLAAMDFKFIADGIPANVRQQFYKSLARNIIFNIDYETTYWDVLTTLLGSLDGWMIPTASKVVVRPFLPIPRTIQKVITTKEYTKMEFNKSGNGHPMDKYIGGGIAYGSGTVGENLYLANKVRGVLGIYTLPKALHRNDAIVRYEFNPALNDLVSSTSVPATNGAAVEEMLKPFFRNANVSALPNIPNADFVVKWLGMRCIQRAIASSGIVVYTPLRFDIGIGNGVEVKLPTTDGSNSLGSFVGTVSGFDIQIDAETKTPVSIYRLAGVLEKSVYDNVKSESKNAFASQVEPTGAWCA